MAERVGCGRRRIAGDQSAECALAEVHGCRQVRGAERQGGGHVPLMRQFGPDACA
jgi:hypothetical protein